MKKLNHQMPTSSIRERVVNAPGRTQLGQGAERREEPVEGAEVGAVGRVGAAGDVVEHVAADVLVELVGVLEDQTVQRTVERRGVEPVGRIGYRRRHDGGERPEIRVGVGAGVARGERVPGSSHALGMGEEQLVVVRPADLLEDEGQDVATEVERAASGQGSSMVGIVQEPRQPAPVARAGGSSIFDRYGTPRREPTWSTGSRPLGDVPQRRRRRRRSARPGLR